MTKAMDSWAMTWPTYFDYVEQINLRLGPILKGADCIVGIERGGLLTSVLLSNRWDKPHATIQQDLVLSQEDIDALPKRLVVIDDIVDSGETYDIVMRLLKKSHEITWIALLSKVSKPYLHYVEWARDGWVIFPWESKDAKAVRTRDLS